MTGTGHGARRYVADQRSVNWLAGRAGIAPSTLRYQLQNPSALTVRTAAAISDVLAVTP